MFVVEMEPPALHHARDKWTSVECVQEMVPHAEDVMASRFPKNSTMLAVYAEGMAPPAWAVMASHGLGCPLTNVESVEEMVRVYTPSPSPIVIITITITST